MALFLFFSHTIENRWDEADFRPVPVQQLDYEMAFLHASSNTIERVGVHVSQRLVHFH